MAEQLNDIVRFRGDRLFNGAVNIDWFNSDESKAKAASEAFVFHGPKYHGVSQDDVGSIHGHKLIDTANFARSVIRRCYGIEDEPFTLAIAGYGTGKSHLGITLASLVSDPGGETAQQIISALELVDANIGRDLRLILQETDQPCLAVTLNGMQGFDLSAELLKQIINTLNKDGYDSRSLDDLRPRFAQAAALVRMSNETVINELLAATEEDSIDCLINQLGQQDERTYAKVHDFFADRGMPIRALSGESIRDVIDIVAKEYCGAGKPYRSLIIFFDEFGKYTEFATVKSQIAGNGVLQDLFESIQANANNACFVGFIQFELNAYVQRIAPEFKNEILRYITRYQSANRLYLSINLETLIASLFEKKQENLLKEQFDNNHSKSESREIMANISKWFPHSQNHSIWGDEELFHSVIRKGCWPLSPYSTWLLFFLASVGKHLQERSALALLGDVFHRSETKKIGNISEWSMGPADLWSDSLQQEFISSEETGQQGTITHAYGSVIAKHGSRLSQDQIKLLRAIVLSSKLGLVTSGKEESIQALSELSSLPHNVAGREIKLLQEEFNVIEWDDSFKAFDILGDAVPRTQFLSFVRQRVASSYDETGKANLFASRAAEWCDLLADLKCDFADENKIYSQEWRFFSVTSNMDYLAQQIKISSDRWASAIAIDEPRGTVIYTYIGQSRSADDVLLDTSRCLRAASNESKVNALPILVVLLHDSDGSLGQSLAEVAVLDGISETDKAKFGNLIGAHKEKQLKMIREKIDLLIKDRLYSTAVKDDFSAKRLNQVGTELFKRIYKSPISFPFDGFGTGKGANGADTCHELTRELMHGKLNFEGIIQKPVKVKNRAVTVLKDTWDIFNQNGSISRRPKYPVIRALTEKWDDVLSKEQKLPLAESIQQICRPPYGANIASAGLFLGVYIAPRYENMVVMQNGCQMSISEWIQDGIFKGKYINLASLNNVDLMNLGEASSEWETLLDEWEQCEDFRSRVNYSMRSLELKRRSPVPPMLVYREDRLQDLAEHANNELAKAVKIQNDAWRLIEKSQSKMDCSLASWGAAMLKEHCDSMISETPLWTDMQINEIEKDYANARQYAIHYFSEWLKYQSPISDNPSDVGDFKHKMIRVIGSNLKQIGLENEFTQLESYTLDIIKNAEKIAEARQLVRDIQSWLESHADATKIGRIAELRALKQVGFDYAKKLQKLTQRTNLSDVTQLRSELSEFMQKIKVTEDGLMNRASAIWNAEIQDESDLDKTISEVDSLIHSFDNIPNDLEDFELMRKALKIYRMWYQRLSDNNLSWGSFSENADEMLKECEAFFGEEEVPWNPEDVKNAFIETISAIRQSKSLSWISRIRENVDTVDKMSAIEANQYHTQLSNPPSVLTAEHHVILNELIHKVDQRLSDLKIEWLVEKFKELSQESKIEFIRIVQVGYYF